MLKLRCAGAVAVLLLAGACARMPSVSIPSPFDLVAGPSTVHVEIVAPKGEVPLMRGGQAISLAIAEVADARTGDRGRKIGTIKATVTNMYGSELTLDQSVTALLGAAMRGQLAADGFHLRGAHEPADFRLNTTVKEFTLNIAGTDELSIVTDATLLDGKSGEVIWAGTVTEQGDRYAGVSGNSRSTIVAYLGDSVAAFCGKTSATIRGSLMKSHPQSIAVSTQTAFSSVPGVVTTKPVALRDTSPTKVAPPAIPVAAAPLAPSATILKPLSVATSMPMPAVTSGYLLVSSVPGRAKIYVEDVYYGLTPMKVELPAGVNQMHFKLDGFRSASEKVAVRRGETTELEIKFQK